MSFWFRQRLMKFNPNHADDGKFTGPGSGPDSGPMLTDTFEDQQRGNGYTVKNPGQQDDKMQVLQSLLDKIKLKQAEEYEATHARHDGLEDFALADDEG
jgi:hypothetical protein